MSTERFYPGTLANQQTIITRLDVLATSTSSIQPVRWHVKRINGNQVTLNWRDPPDAYEVQWASTRIVKKQNAVPAYPTDGTLVVETTTRNQYASTGYVDTQADAGTWYYKAFPYFSAGLVNVSDLNIFADSEQYGFYIDTLDADENSCVHYIGANTDFNKLYMDFNSDTLVWGDWQNAFFMPKPCMLNLNGTVAYYLNPSDYTKKADGTASDVTNTAYAGNAMMEFPAIYYKIYTENNKHYFLIADNKIDDDYECWSCKKADGTYSEHFYLPCYEGSVVSGTLRSMSTGALPTGSTNSTNEYQYATNNGSGWYPTLWADEMLMRMLGTLVFGRLNSQEAIGSLYKAGSGSLYLNCGSLNAKGLFYGKRFNGVDNQLTGTKFFGMENWWGHRWRRSQGFNTVGSGAVWVKMTPSMIDGSKCVGFKTSDSEADYTGNYVSAGSIYCPMTSGDFITGINATKFNAFSPTTVAGSSATYFCDKMWSNTDVKCIFSGGNLNDGYNAGLFAFNANLAPSHAFWIFGASLSYRPL